MSDAPLKIFVVDDDPTARMIATFSFDSPDYTVAEFESGAQCLAALHQKPDVILMDVEMPERDGISTCQALRAAGETSAQVIFLSAHNDLETRMRAYDAGGNDYLVKPYEPEEVLKKVSAAQQFLAQQRSLSAQAQYAQQVAFSAMSSMGELGVVMQFMRESFSARTPDKLAESLFAALRQLEVTGIVEMRHPSPVTTASSQGSCTPLELSILAHARGMDRIFQFHDRLIINFPGVTLVAFNLPLHDMDRVGRLRDNLAILAEGIEARLDAIASDQSRMSQAEGIGEVLADLTATLQSIESTQDAHRMSVLGILNDYVTQLEASYVHMGLSQDQEQTMTGMALTTADQVGRLMGEDKDLSDRLRKVSDRLKALSEAA